jgi:G:T-mismatch repair DNA endonuclease (very short patch repair protein)
LSVETLVPILPQVTSQIKSYYSTIKGKTYEEIHGLEKAKQIKQKQSKGHKGHPHKKHPPSPFKGKTFEQRYGVERAKEIQIKFIQNHKGHPSPFKDKTFEQRLGTEKAKIVKQKLSKSHKQSEKCKQQILILAKENTGKTWEQRHGEVKAKEMKLKLKPHLLELSKRWKGKKLDEIYSPEEVERVRNINSEFHKSEKVIHHLRTLATQQRGISYDERYSPEKAKIIKEKQSVPLDVRYANNPEKAEHIRMLHSEARAKMKLPFKDSKPEKLTQAFLTNNNIPFRKHVLIKLVNSYHRVDVLLKDNLVIEVEGCFVHQCEQCGFTKGYYGKTSEQIREKDNKIYSQLNSLGYRVIRLWEHDINVNDFSILESQHLINI